VPVDQAEVRTSRPVCEVSLSSLEPRKFGLELEAKLAPTAPRCSEKTRGSGRAHVARRGSSEAKRVMAMHRDGLSYRLIGRNLGLSNNTVMEIVRRNAA
jgi:DNA-binding NarL/FixJ family response regulator